MPLTLRDFLAFGGLGKEIHGQKAKDSIYQGGQMAGFDACCVEFSGPIKGSIDGGVLKLGRPKGGTANGTFIRNHDDLVTFGPLGPGGFIVSDQFGGCDMTILKAPDNTIWGAHVFSSDTCRAAMSNLPAGWRTLETWGTAGYEVENPDCSSLFVFTFFEGGKGYIVAAGGGGFPIKLRNISVKKMFDI